MIYMIVLICNNLKFNKILKILTSSYPTTAAADQNILSLLTARSHFDTSWFHLHQYIGGQGGHGSPQLWHFIKERIWSLLLIPAAHKAQQPNHIHGSMCVDFRRDKDKKPQWRYNNVNDIDHKIIKWFFKPLTINKYKSISTEETHELNK